MVIKTRFAPSPTGDLHIGNVRTLLYSWLFARSQKGKFILRIEDTDVKRSNITSVKNIINNILWLGLDWDEGPYFQNKRINYYYNIINEMISKGIFYKCFCSHKRLKNLRILQIKNREKPKYDGYCRNIDYKKWNNIPYVVRFKNPDKGIVIFNDLIRGVIKFNNKELDDLIIQRTDGSLTYNFCTAIDDLDAKITHVIRGEEHISNTPKQINILKAIGSSFIPNYAHVSLILDNKGKKISKNNYPLGIMDYRNDGILPETILNYILRLGWSYGNKEIFTINEMKKLFILGKINKAPCRLNDKKLLWLNHYYINNLSIKYVIKHLQYHFKKQNIIINDDFNLIEIVKFLGKRFKTLKEIASNCYYFYNEPKYDNFLNNNLFQSSGTLLKLVYKKLFLLEEWNIDSINLIIKKIFTMLHVSFFEVAMPIRIAITGMTISIPIINVIYYLGKTKSLNRLNQALLFINKSE